MYCDEYQFIFVKTAAGDSYECMCYIVMNEKYTTDDNLPYDWYVNHCIIGAEENNLPGLSISFLQIQATKIDGNSEREKKNVIIKTQTKDRAVKIKFFPTK